MSDMDMYYMDMDIMVMNDHVESVTFVEECCSLILEGKVEPCL